MRKLIADTRVAMLGAAGGLFSTSVFLLVRRIDAYYTYLSSVEATSYDRYWSGAEDLWWIPICFWNVLLSIGASLFVHRYLPNLQRSVFLLWQTVGIIVLLAWGLSFSVLVGMDCLMSANTYPLERAIGSVEGAKIAKYLSAVFACNVFYGSALHAASRQYPAETGSLIEGPEVSPTTADAQPASFLLESDLCAAERFALKQFLEVDATK